MKFQSPFYPDALTAFKKSRFFSGLNQQEIETMLQGFLRETWKKGSIFPSQQTLERFRVLIKGRIEMIKMHPDTGRELTVMLLNPGDAFDVVTLVDGKAHDVIPQALDDLEVLSVPMSTVRNWINVHPAFNQTLLPYLGEQMRTLENLAADLALHDTVTRLGKVIMRHAVPGDMVAEPHATPVKLVHNLSHETLARMTGSVRVVVSRHIQHWKEQGTVDVRRKELAIRDLGELVSPELKEPQEIKGNRNAIP